jgi:hypothetical protein
LANAIWRTAHHTSWSRHRELLTALLRLGGFGGGMGWRLVRCFVDCLPPAAGDGAAALLWHVMVLLLASGAMSLLTLWFARPLRVG